MWITPQQLAERRKQGKVITLKCRQCHLTKPVSEFQKGTNRCKSCGAEYARRWRIKTGKRKPTMVGE